MQWLLDHANHGGTDCLLWPFARNKSGYATISHPDRPGTMIASRMMCIIAHGEPSDPSDYACHDCNNGHLGCVNPKHLRWDDNRGNQMDRVAAGNSNRGSRHGNSKLTESDVRQIRKLAKSLTRQEIAERFDVSVSAIHLIMQGRTWGWLK
ncbi:hypothetical protein D1227_06425 [Henriciella mobilis]|nr:hypothetical protein [Henriciella mobilis]RIJ23135.1 hypothetical protein D1227_06425 [Henriciella mobilis]